MTQNAELIALPEKHLRYQSRCTNDQNKQLLNQIYLTLVNHLSNIKNKTNKLIFANEIIRKTKEKMTRITELDLTTKHRFMIPASILQNAYNFKTLFAEIIVKRYSKSETDIVPLDAALTNSEISRLRYGKSLKNQFECLGSRWGLSFSLYKDICPCWKEVESFLNLFEIFQDDITAGQLFDTLKAITTFAKTVNITFSENWKYFINLETFGWFHCGTFTEKHKAELLDWLVTKRPHKINNSEDTFNSVFRSEVFKLLNELNKTTNSENLITLKEYLQDINKYCLSGSTHKKVRIHVDGKKPRKSKKAAYLSLTQLELYNWIMTYEQDTATVIMKQETGKVRPVVNAGDHLYLQMSYISDYLDKILKGNKLSTLWTSSNQNLAWKLDLINNCYSSIYCHMPLDQSHFDHQPTKEMICSVNAAIKSILPANTDYVRVMDLIIQEMEKGTLVTLPDKSVILATKGILSGWKWTALYDTIINIVTFRMACQISKVNMVQAFIAQGDDDLIVALNESDAYRILFAYKEMNFEVNPNKTFLSNTIDEYLRVVYDGDSCSGYLARGVRSVIIASPINKAIPDGELRANALLTNWITLLNRGGINIDKHMVKDIAEGTSISTDIVNKWLRTPRCYGGGGLSDFTSNDGYAVKPGSAVVPKRITNIKLTKNDKISTSLLGPGLNETVKIEIKGEYKKIEDIRLAGQYWKIGNYDVIPRFTIRNTWYIQRAIEVARQTKDFTKITAILEPSSVETLMRIQKHGSRRILIDWLQSRLPSCIPIVKGWSADSISPIAKDEQRQVFQHVLSLRKFSYATLLRYLCRAEYNIMKIFTSSRYRVAN